MHNFRKALNNGYNREEAYFFEEDLKLIKDMRERRLIDKERAEAETSRRNPSANVTELQRSMAPPVKKAA